MSNNVEKRLIAAEKKLEKIEKKNDNFEYRLYSLESATLQSMVAAVNYFLDKGWTKTRIRKMLQL